MLSERERTEIIRKAATRMNKNLNALQEPEKQIEYIMKLLNMFDNMHLSILDFAIEMTPEQPEPGEPKQPGELEQPEKPGEPEGPEQPQ